MSRKYKSPKALQSAIDRKINKIQRESDKNTRVFANEGFGAAMRKSKVGPSFNKEDSLKMELEELQQQLSELIEKIMNENKTVFIAVGLNGSISVLNIVHDGIKNEVSNIIHDNPEAFNVDNIIREKIEVGIYEMDANIKYAQLGYMEDQSDIELEDFTFSRTVEHRDQKGEAKAYIDRLKLIG